MVYSTEVPDPAVGLLPLAEEEHTKGAVHERAPVDEFRVRILPVFGTLATTFRRATNADVLVLTRDRRYCVLLLRLLHLTGVCYFNLFITLSRPILAFEALLHIVASLHSRSSFSSPLFWGVPIAESSTFGR